jgi:hypothetical protein
MELTDPLQEVLAAAVASRRAALELERRIQRDIRAELQRRAGALHHEREQFARRLRETAGFEPGTLDAVQEQEAQQAQAFLERQRRVLVEHGSAVARQQERAAGQLGAGLAVLPEPLAAEKLTFRSLVTLDTVAAVKTSPAVSRPGLTFAVKASPATSMHNVVKALAEEQTAVQRGFHVPGFPVTFEVDFLFTWRADADVALNAITFVQPNGMYALLTSWAAFATSGASVDFTAGLDVFVQNARGPGFVQSSGTRDDRLSRRIDISWFDFLGAADIGPYSDQSALFTTSTSRASTGRLVIFDAWVALTVWADGDATSVLDFYSGDFGINVPAVYVPTFTVTP